MSDNKLVQYRSDVKDLIANKEAFKDLATKTFKGLSQNVIPAAIMEGMMKGFSIENFMVGDVYAIPFKGDYSLVTAIGYMRKVGMKNGLAGKSSPEFTFKESGKVDSCTVTIKRNVEGVIGEYSATVFFDEYNTGRNLWTKKPRTMIAKVAEMHALRSAFPEDLSNAYGEDEMVTFEGEVSEAVVNDDLRKQIKDAKTSEELMTIYSEHEGLGKELTALLTERKEEIKVETENENS